MRFSIIIPNYNKGAQIKECLDSIFNQTIDKSKYEVLFVDDGSNDSSLEIANNYDVKILRTDRRMAGGARNKGLDNAIGEYVLFLDSDDYLYSNNVLENLDKHITGEDSINLPFIRERKDGNQLVSDSGLSIEEKIEKSRILACYAKCVKRDLYKNIRFLEKCYYEDVSFALEVLCNIKTESDFNEPFIFYRLVEGSITKTEEISVKKMIDVFLQISSLYYLCEQFPQYSIAIHNRIKKDKLKDRIDILDEYFETGYNSFYDKFKRS